MQRILAAVDGSDHAYKAFEFAADLAKTYGADLIALHVISDRPLSDGERRLAETEYLGDVVENLDVGGLMESKGDPRLFARELLKVHGETGRRVRRAIGARYLQAAEERARARGLRGVEAVIEEGDPAETILQTAARRGADLIVTGSRGLSDLKGALMGSVSHNVAHHAPCTCITVK